MYQSSSKLQSNWYVPSPLVQDKTLQIYNKGSFSSLQQVFESTWNLKLERFDSKESQKYKIPSVGILKNSNYWPSGINSAWARPIETLRQKA